MSNAANKRNTKNEPSMYENLKTNMTPKKVGEFIVESTARVVVGGAVTYGLVKGGQAIKAKIDARK